MHTDISILMLASTYKGQDVAHVFLFPAYFTQHDILELDPFCCKW